VKEFGLADQEATESWMTAYSVAISTAEVSMLGLFLSFARIQQLCENRLFLEDD
jgi:hypothetical protein